MLVSAWVITVGTFTSKFGLYCFLECLWGETFSTQGEEQCRKKLTKRTFYCCFDSQSKPGYKTKTEKNPHYYYT